MPVVSPVIVLLVAGGLPATVVAVCAVEPMYGVILYELTGRRWRGGPRDVGRVLAGLTAVDAGHLPGRRDGVVTSTQ